LISALRAAPPQARINARQALQHDYFSDIPQILEDPPRLV
jgi:hypothetical protein